MALCEHFGFQPMVSHYTRKVLCQALPSCVYLTSSHIIEISQTFPLYFQVEAIELSTETVKTRPSEYYSSCYHLISSWMSSFCSTIVAFILQDNECGTQLESVIAIMSVCSTSITVSKTTES